jgi:hypothetical protein
VAPPGPPPARARRGVRRRSRSPRVPSREDARRPRDQAGHHRRIRLVRHHLHHLQVARAFPLEALPVDQRVLPSGRRRRLGTRTLLRRRPRLGAVLYGALPAGEIIRPFPRSIPLFRHRRSQPRCAPTPSSHPSPQELPPGARSSALPDPNPGCQHNALTPSPPSGTCLPVWT